jgi:hypothetical protein
MRTTLTIDDAVAKELKKRAAEAGVPFKRVVNEALRRGLSPQRAARRYRLRPASLGGPRAGVDLTKALALAAALEDEERSDKLSRRR